MSTTTKSKSIKIGAKTVKVTIERGTWDETIGLDGMDCGIKTHSIDRTEIALYDGSKKLSSGNTLSALPKQHSKLADAVKAGCVGIVGNSWFVKPETADAIRSALAELEAENPKTAEQIAIETRKAEAQARADAWLDSAEYREMVEMERKMDDPNSDY